MPPRPDARGRFEPVVGRAPAEWPWALPHLYAANVAPDPGSELTGASASPDGTFAARRAHNSARHRFEVLGYWGGEFRVVHVEHAATRAGAAGRAGDYFAALPVRYLMAAGRISDEHAGVEVTGEWPQRWRFVRLHDLGVLCAFLCEELQRHGAAQAAADLRASIRPAPSPTEQIALYGDVLRGARARLSGWLPAAATDAIDEALATIDGWLGGHGRR